MRLRSTLTLAVALAVVCGAANVVGAQDWSSWDKPVGFMTPSLEAGQYALSSGLLINGFSNSSTSTLAERELGSLITRSTLGLRVDGLYALTDRIVVATGLRYSPKQSDSDQTYHNNYPEYYSERNRYDLDHALGVDLLLTFKPVANVELFGQGSYSHSRTDHLLTYPNTKEWNTNESFSLFIGFATAR